MSIAVRLFIFPRVELRPKTPTPPQPINGNGGAAGGSNNNNRRLGTIPLHFPPEGSTDDIISRYADYGSTPPRTRIKNKNRDWDRKAKLPDVQSPTTPPTSTLKMKVNNSRMSRSRVLRRNTMDCALLNEIFVEDEIKRNDKRAITIQRGEDRDSKLLLLNVPPTIPERASPVNLEDRVESLPGNWRPTRISNNNLIIESANRYMCVASRPVEQIGTRMSAPPATFLRDLATSFHLPGEAPRIQTRKEFHETFANLIKLGTTDKADSKVTSPFLGILIRPRGVGHCPFISLLCWNLQLNRFYFQISQDEHKYQTELKDLIWLELQAWHADRTLDQQDKFLYAARQNVGELLNDIMEYK